MPSTLKYTIADFTPMQDGNNKPELSGWYVTFEWYIDKRVANSKHKHPEKLCAADFMWWDSTVGMWKNVPGCKACPVEIGSWFGLKEKPTFEPTKLEKEQYRKGFDFGRALQRESDARKCREIQTLYLGIVKPVHMVAKECEEAINTNTGSLT